MTTPFPFQSAAVLTAAQMNAITTLPINDQTASYVALVGDVGKRIVMNVATANTLTINDSIFAVGDTIFCACKGAGSTTITAGAGVTINTSSSLVLAQHGGGTLVALSASVFTFFSQQSATYGVATGGTATSITVSGQAYTLLEILTDTNLVVSKSGLFDIFAVGGGGSGGGAADNVNENQGGGGGASVLQTTIFLTAATYAVDIGAGAASGSGFNNGLEGFVTSIGTIYYAGGGSGGGSGAGRPNENGVICGGGGNTTKAGGVTTAPNIGFSGGTGAAAGSTGGAGGGAGAAGAGSNGTTSVGGAPGAGISPSTFSGATKTTTVSGGGGGGRGSGSGGTGVDGGGSGTSSSNGAGTAGTTNRGGGGGGSNGTGVSGAGSSGLCYIRFKV